MISPVDEYEIVSELRFEVSNDETEREQEYYIKMENIKAFLSIDRRGLQNGKNERRLLMYRTKSNESVYIQYPGKESTDAYQRLKSKNIMNPYDFRPELQVCNGELIAKLSIKQIINVLSAYIPIIGNNKTHILAAIIICMAYMKSYQPVSKKFSKYNILYDSVGNEYLMELDEQKEDMRLNYLHWSLQFHSYIEKWPKLKVPNRDLSSSIEISLEGFLYYLELLAQQEDCKYYYLSSSKKKMARSSVGKKNNLLTIVNIINIIREGRLVDDKMLQKIECGVVPIEIGELTRASGGIIKIKTDK